MSKLVKRLLISTLMVMLMFALSMFAIACEVNQDLHGELETDHVWSNGYCTICGEPEDYFDPDEDLGDYDGEGGSGVPDTYTGVYLDGKYYQDGVLYSGTVEYRGKVYVVYSGEMVSFSGIYNEKVYKDGELLTGYNTDGKYYKDGAIFTGTLENGKYYVDGVVFEGEQEGKYYENGVLFSGYKTIEDVLYKISNGEKTAYTGEYQDKLYEDGVLQNGFITVSERLYAVVDGVKELYTGEHDGKMYNAGSLVNGMYDGKYYEDGVVASGDKTIDGKLYTIVDGVLTIVDGEYNGKYYDAGVLYTGFQFIEEKVYQITDGIKADNPYSGLYANSLYVDGILFTGKYEDEKYYSDGLVYTGLTVYEETLYNVNDGEMVVYTGLYENKLYVGGELYTGTYSEDNKLYVGGELFTGNYTDGNSYSNGVKVDLVVGSDGQPITGVHTDGKLYKDGIAVTGKHTDGKYYNEGVLFSGFVVYRNTLYEVTNGDMVEYNGIYSEDNKLYSEGKLFTGENNGYVYKLGELATGLYNGKVYENGVLFNGYTLVNNLLCEVTNGSYKMYTGVHENKYYNAGLPYTGILTYQSILYNIADGVMTAYTGERDGKIYVDGVKLTGLYAADGKVYVEGILCNDFYDGRLYADGVLFTGINNKLLYVDGMILTGVYAADGKTYKDGVLFTGQWSDGKYYNEGLIIDGIHTDGKLYVAGELFNGDKEGVWYVDGEAYTGIKDDLMYVNGLIHTGQYAGKQYKDGVLLNGVIDGYLYVDGVKFTGVYTDGNTYSFGQTVTSNFNMTHFTQDRKVYYMKEALTDDEYQIMAAIQGLFARKNVTIYIDARQSASGINVADYYMTMAEEYGVTYETITFDEVVQMYIDNWSTMVAEGYWGSAINISTGFKSGSSNAYTGSNGYSTPGYVLHTAAKFNSNIACTLAGITGFIPVNANTLSRIQDLGLTEKMNITSSAFTYEWCFNSCKSELSKDGLTHIKYWRGGSTSNPYILDYGICNKHMFVYYNNSTTISESLMTSIHSHLNKNTVILGYAYSEDHDVALFSEYGQYLIPSDFCFNLTFHVSSLFQQQNFTQNNNDRNMTAQSGKHYVAFVVSDGDNAQYWQNTQMFSDSYMNANGKEYDTFPVTWSISPSFSDMMPLVMQSAYHGTYTNQYDSFIGPVCGHAYINAGSFMNTGTTNTNAFMSKMNTYMKKADQMVTTVMGAANYTGTYNGKSGRYAVFDRYADVDAVKGAIVYEGDKYYNDSPTHAGGVYWRKGKPFIVPRESLWNATPAYIAARINYYASVSGGTNKNQIDAYTVVNVHPWSHTYSDIRKIVNMLDSNIEVVSVDAIVNMMRANVTNQSDSGTEFTVPIYSGGKLSDSYTVSNLSGYIRTDIYNNEFVAGKEDWSGCSWTSSDAAASTVYSTFNTGISIGAGSTATKSSFTMPTVSNAWLTMYARANSTSATTSTTMQVSMTVNGVTKTVVDSKTLYGVSGTETNSVSGEGWQTIAFPISQYFDNYQGKTATISVKNTGSTSLKITNVSLEAKTPSWDNVDSNEFNGKTMEDWILGHQFATSQYAHCSTKDHTSGTYNGYIDMDVSDGGGEEKRNANINVWIAKYTTLKESNAITLTYKVTSAHANAGALGRLVCLVGGKYIVLQDWEYSSAIGEVVINLTSKLASAGINASGQKITFMIEVMDSRQDNGADQDYQLQYFNLTAN